MWHSDPMFRQSLKGNDHLFCLCTPSTHIVSLIYNGWPTKVAPTMKYGFWYINFGKFICSLYILLGMIFNTNWKNFFLFTFFYFFLKISHKNHVTSCFYKVIEIWVVLTAQPISTRVSKGLFYKLFYYILLLDRKNFFI